MPTEHNPGATLSVWLGFVRRTRMGRTNKAVALALASYASPNGRDVRPGLARLAIELELSYNVVKAAMGYLRRMQLIEVVAYGKTSGRSDEYRLTLGADVLELVPWRDPEQHYADIEKLRTAHARGGDRKSELRPGAWAVDDAAEPDATAHGEGCSESTADDATAHGVVGLIGATAHGVTQLRPTPWAATSHRELPPTEPTTHTSDHPESAVTPSRASPQDPNSDPLPKLCVHGLDSRLRGDGRVSCPMCRRAAAAALTHPSLALRLVTPRETA